MTSTESILNKIADYLARRDHSHKEIQEKLEQKKIFDKNEIQEALKKAHDYGWFLPEGELAEKVHRSLVQKHKSFHYILHYLEKKGLPRTHYNAEEERQAALYHLNKKFSDLDNLDYNDKQKALRSLAQKGFNKQICMELIKNLP